MDLQRLMEMDESDIARLSEVQFKEVLSDVLLQLDMVQRLQAATPSDERKSVIEKLTAMRRTARMSPYYDRFLSGNWESLGNGSFNLNQVS